MTGDSFNIEHIKMLMPARGFKTQSALAKAAQLHPSTLSRIINGRYNPTSEEIQAIKAALGWDSQDEAALRVLARDGEEPHTH